ncbi:MAG: serine/threonine protein phosphatase [Ruminococcaceae bacterium]|nr:serine/threonine protein phosphatase [Oscillospiraceae bacterium]
MALFVLSDTHLSLGTDKPMDVFGKRWNGYMKRIKEEWESVVTKEDTVVIPGDISWGMDFEEAKEDLVFLDSLPGRKLISKGNHDYWWATKAKQDAFYRTAGITTIELLYNSAYKVGNYMVCGSRGWYADDHNAPKDSDYMKIVNREVGRMELSIATANKIDAECEKLMFLHFPPVYGDYVCEEIVDCLIKHNIKRCYYGHIHGNYDVEPVSEYKGIEFFIVSADYLNFKPLKIE